VNAELINSKLREKLQEKCKVYPQNNLRCSSIGHPCSRYVYLSITNWEDKPAPDVGLQGIFGLGNTLEAHVIEKIKEAGFEVITPTAHSFRIEPQGITGREDLRIKDPETGDLIPVEVKSISPFEFDKLNRFEDFVNHPKPYIRAYAAQIQLYMLKFGKEYAFFALINKLTGEIKFIRVEFDYEYCEKVLSKADYINECLEAKTPPEACEEISLCENCDLQHICGECKRIPADVELDGELEELIKRKEELTPANREYNAVDKQIKSLVGEREKVITGSYLVTRTATQRKGYTVEPSTVYKVNIKRL
jgi:CRISPR/Cas system-associated exonuclease Cas4 (RecB family)